MTASADDTRDIQSGGKKPFYRLRLFVAGDEPNSATARSFVARLSENNLHDSCDVAVVDVLEDYQASVENQVIVVPTLIVESPPPVKIIVGSLSDEGKVLAALGLSKEGGRP